MDGDKAQAGQNNETTGWVYQPGSNAPDGLSPVDSAEPPSSTPNGPSELEWTASEYIAHEKNFGWYFLLGLAAVVVSAIIYLLTKDIVSIVAVTVMAVVVGVAGGRKPKVVTYQINSSGITAGTKFYPFRNYKSFAMLEDGPFASIVLVPMKRLSFPFSAYLAPDSQEDVIEVLADHLPLERGQLDGVDRLMRQLRF